MNSTKPYPMSLFSGKLALISLVMIGASLSLPSHAAPLNAKQQQAVNAHFNKLAQSQNTAENQLTDQLNQEFSQKLTEQEHQLMRRTCPKYGMTFDVVTNACLR